MKTNLKVLMLAMLIGCANFSVNAYWGRSWVDYGVGKIGSGYTFVRTGQNWQDHPYYFTAGVAASAAVTAGVAYLIFQKIKSNREKARLATNS